MVPVVDDLSRAQKQDLEEIILQHQDVFSEVPRRTSVTQHDIKMAPGVMVRVLPGPRSPQERHQGGGQGWVEELKNLVEAAEAG